ncbi:unnamed protein product [Citrullus colocynthis]|uniref:Uncharacterized protein n=1 Tax=Citrullus colocynthis TaxID=252529 RepID=A0ABP0YBT0_9ROSI
MEENIEEMKIDWKRMTKKIDDLVETLKTMIDYMNSTPIGASHAAATPDFKKELDEIEKEQEEKEEEQEMVDGSVAHTTIRRKDDDQDEEGQGKQDPQFKDTEDVDEVINEVFQSIDKKEIYEKLEKSNNGKAIKLLNTTKVELTMMAIQEEERRDKERETKRKMAQINDAKPPMTGIWIDIARGIIRTLKKRDEKTPLNGASFDLHLSQA